MKVSHEKHGQQFVYDCRRGDERLKRVMYGDVQVWPVEGHWVTGLALDMSEIDGTLDGAYWKHALRRVAEGSSPDCYAALYVGGKRFQLQSTFSVWGLAMYSAGVVSFGESRLSRMSVAVGDRVRVWLEVPEEETEVVSKVVNEEREVFYDVPWLPGTRLCYTVGKGQKKTNARWGFEVSGVDSGCVHIRGESQIEGHKRGDWQDEVSAMEMQVHGWWLDEFCDEYAAGDDGVKVVWRSLNGGTSIYGGRLVFPVFIREFELTVTELFFNE